MSSVVIPKEHSQDCQPWELLNLESGRQGGICTDHAAVSLPTIDQVSHIHDQARQEGYDLGLVEGRAEGLAEGRTEAAGEIERLRRIAETFQAEVAKADESISQDVLNLSLDLARAMLKTTLAMRPELILPIVREAINYLPGMKQPALLFLNPDDAVLVKSRLGDELTKAGWNIAEDEHLERGGCRAETPSNQIDASIPTRWQRLAAALGRESDWLAP